VAAPRAVQAAALRADPRAAALRADPRAAAPKVDRKVLKAVPKEVAERAVVVRPVRP
jgi:hypothetical protein